MFTDRELRYLSWQILRTPPHKCDLEKIRSIVEWLSADYLHRLMGAFSR